MRMNLYNNGIYQQDIESAWKLGNFNKLEGSRILITGATGMIALVIIDILMYYNSIINISSQGIHILAISRNEEKARERFAPYWDSDFFTYFSHDISQPLPESRAYATDPIGTITTNVSGTYELLSYAAEHYCRRFLCFSSVEIYGENRKDVDKFGESYLGYIDCNTVRAGYPESKRLSESLCNAFAAQKEQDFVIGRFSRVYGPTMGKDDSKAIAQFIRKAAAGEDIVLKSEGNQLYSGRCSSGCFIFIIIWKKR